MRYIAFSEGIGKELFDKIIDFYNNLDGELCTIYFRSDGGEVFYANAIADLINKNASNTRVVGFGKLCSCAFDLFFYGLKCQKELTDDCIGMYHKSLVSVCLDESGKVVYAEDKARKEHVESYEKRITKSVSDKLRFNAKELSLMKRGKDVWFSVDRMKTFLEISK